MDAKAASGNTPQKLLVVASKKATLGTHTFQSTINTWQ
jgi:hypothetical protein